MVVSKIDEKTRVTLTKQVVSLYSSDEVVVVPMKNEILLIPVSKDPLKALQEEGKKIPKHLTLADLRRLTAEEMEKEIEERAKRRR